MKSSSVIIIGSLFAFIVGGTASLLAITFTESIESLLQFLAVTILLIVIITRFVIPKFQKKSPSFSYFLQFAPLSLFVYLLVFSTGGLASPFLILTHLFAIGMAFLISPTVSMIYVAITVAFIIFNIKTDPSAQVLLQESPFAVFLYILAYGAILPFSQYIAKIYKQKEDWVNELSQMLVTSKKQEETLLKNIEDAVLVLSKNLEISFTNKAVEEKLGYKEQDIINEKFSKVFRLKDENGNSLDVEKKLPFSVVINTKLEAKIDKLQISKKDNYYMRANIKLLPVIDHSGTVLGIMVIVKEYSQIESDVADNFDKAQANLSRVQTSWLKKFAVDNLLMVRLDSEISEGLSSFINLSELVENKMYENTNAASAKKVFLKCPSPADNKVLPKGKVLMANKHCSFPVVYVLANETLLAAAIDRLTSFGLEVASTNAQIFYDIKIDGDIAKLEITIPTENFPPDKKKFLFTKFFNYSLAIKGATEITGLEVAIAETIFEKHAGSLHVEATPSQIKFTASLPKPEVH